MKKILLPLFATILTFSFIINGIAENQPHSSRYNHETSILLEKMEGIEEQLGTYRNYFRLIERRQNEQDEILTNLENKIIEMTELAHQQSTELQSFITEERSQLTELNDIIANIYLPRGRKRGYQQTFTCWTENYSEEKFYGHGFSKGEALENAIENCINDTTGSTSKCRKANPTDHCEVD